MWLPVLEPLVTPSPGILSLSRVVISGPSCPFPGHLQTHTPVARHRHNLEPTSRAAPPPPPRPDNTTQPQTQEALLSRP